MRVGLCLPIAEIGLPRKSHSFAQMREMAHLAESAGFDSIWVADHLFKRGRGPARGYWESIATLGALANATQRVELGPLVLCTPFRNPGLVAWAANTLDEISGGRFVLGLGAGWHRPEFDAFGFEYERRVSYLRAALEVIAPLLRKGEVRPPGPRGAGPPLLIAGTGPRMLGLIARHGDRWNTVWYERPDDEFREKRRRLEQACAEAGRAQNEIEVTAGVLIRDPAQIGDQLHAWREEGAAEVMCRLEPPSLRLIEAIGGSLTK